MKPHWKSAAEYAGLSVSARQTGQIERFGQWLMTEGVRAGGIGPNEIDRVDLRHLADSLLFATELKDQTEVWDLGTGIGLPGTPLAVLLPHINFTLVDRSGRRVDLLRRVTKILELENCQVLQSEIEDLEGSVGGIVARASLPPDRMLPVAEKHLVSGGVAVLGGSWSSEPTHSGWTTKEIPGSVLDQTVWLLIMRRS